MASQEQDSTTGQKASDSGHPRAGLTATGKEVFDFYVWRRWEVFRDVNQWHIRCRPTADGSDMNKSGHHYDPDDIGYSVRVPALMLFQCNEKDKDLWKIEAKDYLLNRYRPQSGAHLLVSTRKDRLIQFSTFWADLPKITGQHNQQPESTSTASMSARRRKYAVSPKCCPLSAVYPCLRNASDKSGAELVIGLAFIDRIPRWFHRRTYGRLNQDRNNKKLQEKDIENEYVLDITEQFLENQGSHYYSFLNRDLFPESANVKNPHVYAFYVCRGARLIVMDDKIFNDTGEVVHCRSLFQEGSLVVVRGWVRPEFCIGVGRSQRFYEWQDFRRQYLRPKPTNRLTSGEKAENEDKPFVTTFDDVLKMVFFLGAIESQHNSVCWELTFPSGKYPQAHHGFLRVPEGGRFVDITTWSHGMELIRSKHKYQRLYESVVLMEDHKPIPNASQFEVPSTAIEERILGVGNGRECAVVFPYEEQKILDSGVYTHDSDSDLDIRRFLAAKGLETDQGIRLWFEHEIYNRPTGWTQPLPPFPLYPPLAVRRQENIFSMEYWRSEHKIVLNGSLKDRDLKDVFGLRFIEKTQPSDVYKLAIVDSTGKHWTRDTTRGTGIASRVGVDYLTYKLSTVDKSADSPEQDLPPIQALVLVKQDQQIDSSATFV